MDEVRWFSVWIVWTSHDLSKWKRCLSILTGKMASSDHQLPHRWRSETSQEKRVEWDGRMDVMMEMGLVCVSGRRSDK